MPTKLTVVKADLSVETGYISPAFGLFRDIPALLQHLFARLQSHVPRLQEMKVERGTENSFGEFHVACHLYGLRLGVRVYAEKVSIVFINVLENEVEKFGSVVVDALSAVKEHQPTLAFQTHTMAVVLHGTLEGKSVREYLSSFVRNVPNGLGPHTGSGGVMYFGAEDDRIGVGFRRLASLRTGNCSVRVEVRDRSELPIDGPAEFGACGAEDYGQGRYRIGRVALQLS